MFFQNCYDILSKYGSSLLLGVRTTLIVSLIGTAFGLVLGLLVGGLRAVRLDITSSSAARFFKKSLMLSPTSTSWCSAALR